jgi:hypothetical protein
MTNEHSISPLRQRMIDDMTLRKLSPRTQAAYLRGGGEVHPLLWPLP